MMKRFFGMMPTDEIQIEKFYKDKDGWDLTIQAGPHGWSVIFMDGSSLFKDIDDTSENNFEMAYQIMLKKARTAVENGSRKYIEVCDER